MDFLDLSFCHPLFSSSSMQEVCTCPAGSLCLIPEHAISLSQTVARGRKYFHPSIFSLAIHKHSGSFLFPCFIKAFQCIDPTLAKNSPKIPVSFLLIK